MSWEGYKSHVLIISNTVIVVMCIKHDDQNVFQWLESPV